MESGFSIFTTLLLYDGVSLHGTGTCSSQCLSISNVALLVLAFLHKNYPKIFTPIIPTKNPRLAPNAGIQFFFILDIGAIS